jgi:hypothetical protein
MFPKCTGRFGPTEAQATLRSLPVRIISTSFVCGVLCGTGRLYTLNKKWGRWEVISNPIVWVS